MDEGVHGSAHLRRPACGDSMIKSCDDSRTSPRQAALENRARLEWWHRGEFYESDARLVNISDGGALLISEITPPLTHTVWCLLKEPTRTEWIKASVVRHGDAQEIGLAFPTSCPFDFNLAATLGLN